MKPTLTVARSVERGAYFFAKNRAAFYATFIHRPYEGHFWRSVDCSTFYLVMSHFFDVEQFAPRWANVEQSTLRTDPRSLQGRQKHRTWRRIMESERYSIFLHSILTIFWLHAWGISIDLCRLITTQIIFDLHTKELVYLSHSTFYVMSNCKDGGRRRTQNVGENDLRSTLRSYRKGGLKFAVCHSLRTSDVRLSAI